MKEEIDKIIQMIRDMKSEDEIQIALHILFEIGFGDGREYARNYEC